MHHHWSGELVPNDLIAVQHMFIGNFCKLSFEETRLCEDGFSTYGVDHDVKFAGSNFPAFAQDLDKESVYEGIS